MSAGNSARAEQRRGEQIFRSEPGPGFRSSFLPRRRPAKTADAMSFERGRRAGLVVGLVIGLAIGLGAGAVGTALGLAIVAVAR